MKTQSSETAVSPSGTGKYGRKTREPKTYYRKIDALGRVTLPAKIRKKLEIHNDDEVRLFTGENDEIILMKNGPCCAFCDSPYDLVPYRSIHVCTACMTELKKLAVQNPLPEPEPEQDA